MIKKQEHKISDINKLILFNYSQLINSFLYWILFALVLISQPLIIIVIYFVNLSNILSYSLLIILVPLILAFIFMVFQINVLFQDNKTNSIEYKLICSKYPKLKIAFSRIITIYLSLLPIILIQDLFLLIFIGINMTKLLLTLFISNTFISSFIYLFLMLVLVLISLKLTKITFTIFSIIIGIVTLGASLITRSPIISSDESMFKYNTPTSNVNFVRLISKNDELLMVNNKTSSISTPVSNVLNEINNQTKINNFIPSEWLLSFYSTLFTELNFDLSYTNNSWSLLSVKAYDAIANDEISPNNYMNYSAIRPTDNNFMLMGNEQYYEIIWNSIVSIIEKYGLNNVLKSEIIYNFLNQNIYWNQFANSLTDTARLVTNFLKDATGINTEYNQLFYVIKYKNLILSKCPNLFFEIKNRYNPTTANLFEFVLTSDISSNNLFNTNSNILNTEQKIDYFYPEVYGSVINSKPSNVDLNFMKDKLFKFITNENNQIQLTYLMNNSSYSIASNNNIGKLNNLLPNVINYETWTNYIDSISTYNELNVLLEKLTLSFNDIYQYKLNTNSLFIYNNIALLKMKYSYSNSISYICIIAYILLFLILALLIYKKCKSKRKVDIKNDK